MYIEVYKVLFHWLRYPKKDMYIDLREISINFWDGILITSTNEDPYNPDNIKVLTSCSITDIINQIKETVN
jgi:hypothetical protein